MKEREREKDSSLVKEKRTKGCVTGCARGTRKSEGVPDKRE